MQEAVQNRVFLVLLAVVTLLFAWVLRPFWAAIFWGCVMTLLFYPIHRRIRRRLHGRNTLASVLTMIVGFIVVVGPIVAVIFAAIREGTQILTMLEDQELTTEAIVDQIDETAPFITNMLQRFDISIGDMRRMASDFTSNAGAFLAQEALGFGRNALGFALSLLLMIYLTFFLLRDGDRLVVLLKRAVPLMGERKQLLFTKFTEVTRATIKGSLIIALVEGGLGGLIFWILGIQGPVLWGMVMAFLSLVPAIGPALVWGPVAIYLFASGDIVKGVILVFFGSVIIGLADNVLRPRLVGRDLKLPDYIVLFSTLGGLALLGISGFVIGPLIAALFFTFWHIFVRDFNED